MQNHIRAGAPVLTVNPFFRSQAEEQPTFTDVLLDLVQSEQNVNLQLSSMRAHRGVLPTPPPQHTKTTTNPRVFPAVIYLKNRVNRAWQRQEHYPGDSVIPEDAKARFRDRLLPILASSQTLVRHQLVPILQRILHFDFPDRWPTFMDYTVQLLNTNEAPSVLAGLQCLLAICRAYRFKANDGESRAHFDKIIEASFPRLLTICNELVNQEGEEAGEMLHIALKSYKHATWVRLFGIRM